MKRNPTSSEFKANLTFQPLQFISKSSYLENLKIIYKFVDRNPGFYNVA